MGRCTQCEIAYVNGVRCHETGCPEAWRDEEVKCKWCGSVVEQEEGAEEVQEYCNVDCAEAYNG